MLLVEILVISLHCLWLMGDPSFLLLAYFNLTLISCFYGTLYLQLDTIGAFKSSCPEKLSKNVFARKVITIFIDVWRIFLLLFFNVHVLFYSMNDYAQKLSKLIMCIFIVSSKSILTIYSMVHVILAFHLFICINV